MAILFYFIPAKKLEIAAAKLQAEKEAEALRQQQLLNILL